MDLVEINNEYGIQTHTNSRCLSDDDSDERDDTNTETANEGLAVGNETRLKFLCGTTVKMYIFNRN